MPDEIRLPIHSSIERAARRRELRQSVIIIAGLIGAGVTGYVVIEGWPLLDALYMTVTTLTTVGYMEVHPLSPAGRLFTVALIVTGVGAMLFVLNTIAKHLIEHQFSRIFRGGTMQEAIDRLSQHTIFCGYSRLSQMAIDQMKETGQPFVVIERDPLKVAAASQAGIACMTGDATDEDVLRAAGVQRAKQVVTLLPKDSDNLYVILTCREVNPALYILSRADDELGEKRIRRAGADTIIFPYRIGGYRIADCLLRPHVTKFVDVASLERGKSGLLIEEILIPEGAPVQGLTLRASQIRQVTNVIVAAIIGKDGELLPGPTGDTIIEAGSVLIGIGNRASLRELEKMLLGNRVLETGEA